MFIEYAMIKMNKRDMLFGTIITIVLVYILLTQIDLGDIFNVLFSIHAHWIILGFILYILGYFFRALRFQILLNEKISIKDLFSIVCVHNMVNSIIPARMGELSYIYLIKKREISTGEGIATLMVARIFDFITISVLFFVSILCVRESPISSALLIIAAFLILIILFSLSLIYWREKFMGIIEGIILRLNLNRFHIVRLLLKKSRGITECFKAIKSERVILYSSLFSILIWVSLYLVDYILLRGMGLNLTIGAVILGSTLSIFTTILPVQGLMGFGTIEGGWAIGFMATGISKEVAIVSGFGVHIILIIYVLILGGCGLQSIKFRRR